MSEAQHAIDLDAKLPHVETGSSDGGQCLNRHVGAFKKNNSCSHRWQAWEQMKIDKSLYNAPAYDSLCKEECTTGVTGLYKLIFPSNPNALGLLNQPTKDGKEWDVETGTNFQEKCYAPYWHEAHHVIPNSTLRNAIDKATKDADDQYALVRTIREGLLKETYNINHKSNMIMLPINRIIGSALGLPLHRKTPAHRSHSAYSKHVQSELAKILSGLTQKLDEHEAPEYKKTKAALDKLSKKLYRAITKSEAVSLDDMWNSKKRKRDDT